MHLLERLAIRRNQRTHRIRRLPVLVLSPHSRCNCRCVMCDIWRANANGIELSQADLAPHVESLTQLGVRILVLSGGEALMHRNLWTLCDQLRPIDAKIVLLSTGLLLRKHAEAVVAHCNEVIVSLDGSPDIHDAIRNIPRAYTKLEDGVRAIRDVDSRFRITARCVIQRQNFRDLMNVLRTAEDLGLDQISFLAADVSSEAFNRPGGWPQDRTQSIALNRQEAEEFSRLLVDNADTLIAAYTSGFIAESYEKLTQIADYYHALHGDRPFPTVRCNAPWVSAVVEPDGAIRPCFFLPPYGNLADGDIVDTLNAGEAMKFRHNLDIGTNPTCQRCVCSINYQP